MEYKEYRGCRGLVVAKVEKDDATGYVAGNWIRLAGVQAITHAKTEDSEKHFYDNLAAVIVDAVEGDEVSLTVSIPANKTRALIEGNDYDETLDAIIRTGAKKSYFALGYIGAKDDGSEDINILYKGKFNGGNKVLNTKDDGTTTTNMEYTYVAIHTANKCYTDKEGVLRHAMSFECPMSAKVTEEKIFGLFADGDESTVAARTPDEIIAFSKTV